jgi:hypothetical protein
MKKIAVLAAMIFIFSFQIFADEDVSGNKKYHFSWQLYNYYCGNDSNNILLKYSLGNNSVNLDFQNSYIRYLADTKELSFFDRVYSINETLGDFLYIQYVGMEFLGVFFEDKWRKEQREENRRYNLLHPADPPR